MLVAVRVQGLNQTITPARLCNTRVNGWAVRKAITYAKSSRRSGHALPRCDGTGNRYRLFKHVSSIGNAIMIEFPTKLNALHPFSHNLADEIDLLGEAQYIADLTAGCVLEITPLIAEILSLCESKSNTEIRETLRGRFSDAEISEAYRYLWQLGSAGILFSGKAPRSDEGKTFSNTVLVAPGFLYTIGRQPFVTRLVCYQMLRALCREMELYAPLFVEETDVSLPEDFDWEGVQPFPMPANSTTSYMNQCPVAYGGTFSLPGSGFGGSRHFGFCVTATAVYYVSSGSFDLQSTLDKYFALRDGDRLCVDAWWIKERLSTLIPNPDKIAVVPTGVDSESFQPMDTGGCKTELASAFRNEAIRKSSVGVAFSPTSEPARIEHLWKNSRGSTRRCSSWWFFAMPPKGGNGVWRISKLSLSRTLMIITAFPFCSTPRRWVSSRRLRETTFIAFNGSVMLRRPDDCFRTGRVENNHAIVGDLFFSRGESNS